VLTFLALGLVACGQPFIHLHGEGPPPPPVPALSKDPPPPGLSAVESVVRYVVRGELKAWSPWIGDTVLIPNAGDPLDPCNRSCGPANMGLPPSWPDSVRLPAESAFAAHREVLERPVPTDSASISGLRVRVGPFPDTKDSLQCRKVKARRCAWPGILTLTGIGFNADSTVAVIEVGFSCGALCGSGSLWVLRRAPGHDWSFLWSVETWFS